ncbi:MAG: SulP family inorganic anion transporter [Planctomycetota bacterium]
MGFGGQVFDSCWKGGRFAARPAWSAGRSLWSSARGYRGSDLRGDAVAGLTVAMVAIPQSMAFATIAGVPPIYGLYTAIVGTMVGSLLMSSRYLAIGPTNTMSLLVAGGFVALSVPDADHIGVAVMLTLFAGLIQVLFALARMGELVRYVSHSVIVGFSAGAGVLIAVGQVPAFLGVSLAGTSGRYHGVGDKVDRMIQAIGLNGESVGWEPIAVGVVSLGVALGCRKLSRWLPEYLLAVAAGAGMVMVAGWGEGELALVGTLARGLPEWRMPTLDWDQYRPLFAPAAAIALVGMLDAYGIGKRLASKSGERIDANQEFLSVGASNTVGAFFQCIPSTGSYSRSALNYAAGARTRFAGLFAGGFVAGVFLLLAPLAEAIPMASIAAILFVIAFGLIDWDYVKRIAKSNPADLLVCVGTFVATLTLSLEVAVFVGVFLTIALYLQRARQLYITEMVRTPGVASGFIERRVGGGGPYGQAAGGPDDAAEDDGPPRDPGIVFLQVEGNLFFAAADDLQDRFNDLLASPVRVVILRLKRTHMVDATIMHVIGQFARQMRGDGRNVILCGVRERMYDRMAEYGLVEDLGGANVLVSGDEPFSSAKRAVERARGLVGPSPADPDAEPRGRDAGSADGP